MRFTKQQKQYLNYGLIGGIIYVSYSFAKRFLSGGKTILDLIKVKQDIKNTSSGSIDTSKIDGIVQTIYSAFYGFEFLRFMQWADDDKIIRELNKLTNIFEVRYACESFKSRYNRSLKSDVEYALPDSSLRKIASIVTLNWY